MKIIFINFIKLNTIKFISINGAFKAIVKNFFSVLITKFSLGLTRCTIFFPLFILIFFLVKLIFLYTVHLESYKIFFYNFF